MRISSDVGKSDISNTLKQWRRSSFQWGETDCMLSIGDYLACCGYADLTGDFRGRYSDEAGALAALAEAGGPVELIDRTGVQRLPSHELPQAGDVALIDAGAMGIPGIVTAYGVCLRREQGTIEMNQRHVKIIAVWRP